MDVQVNVTHTSTSDDGKYTIYHILVKTGTRSFTLQKRYTDFSTLRNELESLYSDKIPYPFPKKTFLRKTVSDKRLAEERRIELEKFLQDAINDKVNIKWKKSLPFREFLNLPPGAFSNTSEATKERVNAAWTLSSTKNDEPITDVTIWIDTIRETKATFQEARSKIFVDSGEARKGLILGRARFEGLKKGLEVVTKEGVIGSGEAKRRLELLNSLEREHRDLEVLLSSVSSNPSESLAIYKTPLQQTKKQLFKGRVIGEPQETERTRGQDNQQLLQMQKQDFKNQDQELEQLGSVIRKQKELAVAINEELQLQNELLDELDGEVDRVGNKLHYAQKRVGKFT